MWDRKPCKLWTSCRLFISDTSASSVSTTHLFVLSVLLEANITKEMIDKRFRVSTKKQGCKRSDYKPTCFSLSFFSACKDTHVCDWATLRSQNHQYNHSNITGTLSLTTNMVVKCLLLSGNPTWIQFCWFSGLPSTCFYPTEEKLAINIHKAATGFLGQTSADERRDFNHLELIRIINTRHTAK